MINELYVDPYNTVIWREIIQKFHKVITLILIQAPLWYKSRQVGDSEDYKLLEKLKTWNKMRNIQLASDFKLRDQKLLTSPVVSKRYTV